VTYRDEEARQPCRDDDAKDDDRDQCAWRMPDRPQGKDDERDSGVEKEFHINRPCRPVERICDCDVGVPCRHGQ
jgi:hypothetical protein